MMRKRLMPVCAVAISVLSAFAVYGKTLKHVDPVAFNLTATVTDMRSTSQLVGVKGGGADHVWNAPGYGPVVFHNNRSRAVYQTEYLLQAQIGKISYTLAGRQMDLGNYPARVIRYHHHEVVELLSQDKHGHPVAFIYKIQGEHAAGN